MVAKNKVIGICFVGALVIGMICSCATITPQPPPAGCENSYLYKTSFVPLGPVVVRTALFDVAVLVPESRLIILTASVAAETFFNEGNLSGGISQLLNILVVQSQDPAMLIVVMNARILLETLLLMPDINTATLDACDKNILVSLCQNIRSDVTTLIR